MATNNVKVDFFEIEKTINEIKVIIEQTETYINSNVSNIVNQTDAWEAKYQKAFDKHFQTQTIVNIKKIINNFKSYNNYLEKTIKGYKRIDRF